MRSAEGASRSANSPHPDDRQWAADFTEDALDEPFSRSYQVAMHGVRKRVRSRSLLACPGGHGASPLCLDAGTTPNHLRYNFTQQNLRRDRVVIWRLHREVSSHAPARTSSFGRLVSVALTSSRYTS